METSLKRAPLFFLITIMAATVADARNIRLKAPRQVGSVHPHLVVGGDFDEDGHLDVVGIVQGVPYFFRGDGAGDFAGEVASPATQIAPADAVRADVNNDGHLDVVVGSDTTNGMAYAHLGNGDGTFVQALGIPSDRARRLAVADLDEDGHDDVVILHRDRDVLQVLPAMATVRSCQLRLTNPHRSTRTSSPPS